MAQKELNRPGVFRVRWKNEKTLENYQLQKEGDTDIRYEHLDPCNLFNGFLSSAANPGRSNAP